MKQPRPRIYKDFDLPKEHLPGSLHYVPPRARKSEEIERRHSLPRGVLLAEHVQTGLKVAATILRRVEDPEDVIFATGLIGSSGINTAWYGFARKSDVMRRRLKLPLLAAGDLVSTPDSEMLLRSATADLDQAIDGSGRVIDALMGRRPMLETRQKQLGRQVGNSSLALACVGLGDIIPDLAGFDDYDVQALVRARSLVVLRRSRVLGEQIGSYPSIAQLADPDSELSVHWRRQAPNGALEAYEAATAEHIQLAS